jgi:GT2 family glycosyltransferase
MHKIGIVMVSVNCFEVSKKAMESVKTKYPYSFFWIANGSSDETEDFLRKALNEKTEEKLPTGETLYHQAYPNLRAIINPSTSGLSGCWNLGIQAAFEEGCDYVLVMNNDVVLSPSTIDNLAKRMEKGDAVMVTAVNVQHTIDPAEILNTEVEYAEENDNEHPDFSCFMITKRLIEKVGWFDENYYVAYFEDNDMHGRIAMTGEKAVTIACAPYHHYGSQTRKQNPHLNAIIEEAFIRNRAYFGRKFGIEPPLSDVPAMREKYFKTPYGMEGKSWKDTTIPVDFIPTRKSSSEEKLPESVSEQENRQEGSGV